VAVDGRGCWTSGQPKLNNPSCRGCGCRKRESERLKPPLCVSPLQHQRASEGAARRRTAQQQRSTHALTCCAQHSTLDTGTSVRDCALLTGARSCLAAGSPHIACCNPVTDPNPQPSSASHLIHPSHLLCFCLPSREHVWHSLTQSDFVQIVTFAFTACDAGLITWRIPAQLVHFHAPPAPNCSRFCSCRRAQASNLPALHLQLICKLGAKRPQLALALKFALVLQAVHSHHPRPSPHTAAVASLLLTCYLYCRPTTCP
jgi:hypothetical protein